MNETKNIVTDGVLFDVAGARLPRILISNHLWRALALEFAEVPAFSKQLWFFGLLQTVVITAPGNKGRASLAVEPATWEFPLPRIGDVLVRRRWSLDGELQFELSMLEENSPILQPATLESIDLQRMRGALYQLPEEEE